jgi:hypothetical protein
MANRRRCFTCSTAERGSGGIRKENVFVDLTTFGYCPKTNRGDGLLTVSYRVLYSNQRNIIFSCSRLGAHNFKGN